MKTKNTTELGEKGSEALAKELSSLRAKLSEIHIKVITGEQKNLKESMKVRHEISRVLGILSEKKEVSTQ